MEHRTKKQPWYYGWHLAGVIMHFAALHNDEDSKIHFIIVIQQIWEVLLKSCSTIIENYFSEPYRAILYYTVKQQFNKYCSVIFISRVILWHHAKWQVQKSLQHDLYAREDLS